MKTWLTADLHLGEDRFEIMARPFTNPMEHVNTLIRNHNSLVDKEDKVYIIGDILYQKADPEIYLPQIAKLNGRKTLLRGNHDRVFSDKDLSLYFENYLITSLNDYCKRKKTPQIGYLDSYRPLLPFFRPVYNMQAHLAKQFVIYWP